MRTEAFTYITVEPRALPEWAVIDENARQAELRLAQSAPELLALLSEIHGTISSNDRADYGTSGNWFVKAGRLINQLRGEAE